MLTLTITYDEGWKEYGVVQYLNGIKQENKCYYTSSKQEAEDHMRLTVDDLLLKGRKISYVTLETK